MKDKKEWKEEEFGRFIEPNEIIIEDLSEEELLNIAGKMSKKNGYYLEYWKAPRQESGHLHIKNIKLPNNLTFYEITKYKELIIKKYVRKELWDEVDWNFYNRKENSEPHRIVTENTEHYKGYGIKSLIDTFGENKINPFEEDILEEAKKELKENPKINQVEIEDWNWLVKQAVLNWKEGDRQNNALCLSGYLRKNKGLGIETIKSILTEICTKAEDNEITMRLRAVDETFKKNENEIKGYSGLKFLDEKQDKEIKFDVYTDTDLKGYIPQPVNWLIENQIPKGEIGLLVGKRGRKKTFIGLGQAISITSGKPFLEDKIPEKKKVFFIDEESGKNEIAKRTKLLKAGLGITEDLDITFLSFENIKLNDTSSLRYKAFEELVLNIKPDLIIVDCLQRCVNFEVDRDNQSISEFFTGVVRTLTKLIGCSWLFIHHMRKGNPQNKVEDSLDEIRGGSELVNYCRYVLMVDEPRKKRKEENSLGIFEVIKMSNSQIPSSKVFEFKANLDLISMNYLGTPDEILNTEAKIGEAIKKFIIKEELTGEFRTKDITDNSDEIGFKRSSLSVGIKWLQDNNIIVKEKRGTWRLSSDEELLEESND